MRRNSTSAMGAFHPVLFFMVVYGISLFLAIFVCRTVYNTLNNDTTATQTVEASYAVPGSNATALR
ncbi:MAG TPA: hypothetical protein VFQ73_07215 [Flavisolibacter sp.]|jgi:flagellar biosynthesis protein FliP|nr:hypothetical protein [Flavisolibacter sp.]